jgi:hypothetical protein
VSDDGHIIEGSVAARASPVEGREIQPFLSLMGSARMFLLV